MPNVTIAIGGRDFEVACQEGEEHFLQSAAKMLDTEAKVLVQQIGRMPEARMLLMAGLMLADKTAGMQDQLGRTTEELAALRAENEAMKSEQGALEPSVLDALAERAEALAERLEASADNAA